MSPSTWAVENSSTREWPTMSPLILPLEETMSASIFASTLAFSPTYRALDDLISPLNLPLIMSGFLKLSCPSKSMSSARIVSISCSSMSLIRTSAIVPPSA